MGVKNYFIYLFYQRILRINSHVPWPVHNTTIISNPKKIFIHPNNKPLGYSASCYIQSINEIYIGENFLHAVGLKIISANHSLTDYDEHDTVSPIIIGNNCWCGADVIILPGLKIGDHTIIAAGSVVTKSFEDGDQVIAGNPAKIIKKIKPYSGV